MKSDVTAIMSAMTDAERPWVQTALASILQQSQPLDAIVIMVEEGNDWLEADIKAQNYPADQQSLLSIHRIPLARIGKVRNTGVQHATTRWVAFMDGDDVWQPKKIELQLAAAAARPAAKFVGGDFVFIDSAGRPFAYSNGSTPTPSSWFVDRELMLEHPFDDELKLGEDHFWLIKTRPVCQRIRIPQILVQYRIRGQSISSLQNGVSRQRQAREAMARSAANPIFRYPMLLTTYLRYVTRKKNTYDL